MTISNDDGKSAWASDDETPDGGPGVSVQGASTLRLKAVDLSGLDLSPTVLALADARIAVNRWSPINRLYRALQIAAGDDAPSQYFIDNCVVNLATQKPEMK